MSRPVLRRNATKFRENRFFLQSISIHILSMSVNNNDRAAAKRELNHIDRRTDTELVCGKFEGMNGT